MGVMGFPMGAGPPGLHSGTPNGPLSVRLAESQANLPVDPRSDRFQVFAGGEPECLAGVIVDGAGLLGTFYLEIRYQPPAIWVPSCVQRPPVK